MRTRVSLVADAGPGGATRLREASASGALAVRGNVAAGGGVTVHLVGTAAGPLNGDLVEVAVRVRRGARLRVTTSAASLALPAAGPVAAARLRWRVEVEQEATLDLAPLPLVVAAGATVDSEQEVSLDTGASASLREVIVIGRHRETGGEWTGRLHACVDGVAVLRTSTSTRPLLGDRGTVATLLRLGDAAAQAARAEEAASAGDDGETRWVRTPLARGGVLSTAWGADTAACERALAGPTGRSGPGEPAARPDLPRSSRGCGARS